MLHIWYKHIWVDAPHEYYQSSLFLPHWTSFMESTLKQVRWVPAVGELYYGLNLISLDEIRTIILERPLVRMTSYFSGSVQSLNSLYFQVVTVRNLTLQTILLWLLTSFIRPIKLLGNCQSLPLIWNFKVVIKFTL